MDNIEELLVALGFEVDDSGREAISDFKESIKSTKDLIKDLSKAAVTGVTALTALVVATTANTDQQGKLAEKIDASVESVNALRFANRIAGGSADGMSSSLENLTKIAGETARGVGSGIEAFGILGISVSDANGNLKGTPDLLAEVSSKLQGLEKGKQLELADKLGLSGASKLLQKGPGELQQYIDRAIALGVITTEDAKSAAIFQDSLTDVWQITKQFTRLLTRSLLPIMQENISAFTEWWVSNRQLIEQNLPQYIERAAFWVKVLAGAFGLLVAAKVIGGLSTMIALVRSLGVAMVFTNVAALLLPLLIGAAIAAIALLAQDSKGFFDGQDSFIGRMIDKYPRWASSLRNIAAVFATIARVTTTIFDGWSMIFDLFNNFSLDGLKDVGNNLPGFIDQAGSSLFENVLGFNPGAAIINAASGAANSSFFSNTNDSSRTSGNTLTVDKIEMNVNGVGDPIAVSNRMREDLLQTLQDLSSPLEN